MPCKIMEFSFINAASSSRNVQHKNIHEKNVCVCTMQQQQRNVHW